MDRILNHLKRKWWFWTIMVLVLWGVWYPVYSSEGFRDCINNAGQYPTSQYTNNQSAPIFVFGIYNFRLAATCLGGFADHNFQAITSISAVFLFIITGFLAWFSFDQGRTTRAQLRAYVGPTAVTYNSTDRKVHALIKNFGKTPALQVTTYIGCVFTPPLSKDDSVSDDTSHLGSPSKSVIWPNDALQGGDRLRDGSGAVQAWDTAADQDFQSGKRVIYIFGRVMYTDVFGNHWQTDYRYIVENKDVTGSAVVEPRVCPDGNNAT